MVWDEYFDSAAQGRRPASDFEWYAVDRGAGGILDVSRFRRRTSIGVSGQGA